MTGARRRPDGIKKARAGDLVRTASGHIVQITRVSKRTTSQGPFLEVENGQTLSPREIAEVYLQGS